MTDYFAALEDQLGQATESGVHTRRRLANPAPNPRATALVLGALLLVVVGAVVAVALGIGGSHAVRPDRSTGLPARRHQQRAGAPAVARPSAGGTETIAHGTLPYCVDSTTGSRTPCSPPKARFPTVPGLPIPFSPHPGSAVKLVSQLNLSAPSGGRRPAAVARVVEQAGTLGVTIVAVGLPANTKHNAYAIWLTNGPQESKLLGFVNPAVTNNGNLRAAAILPTHTFRYHQVLITLETKTQPKTPGAVALEGPLHR